MVHTFLCGLEMYPVTWVIMIFNCTLSILSRWICAQYESILLLFIRFVSQCTEEMSFKTMVTIIAGSIIYIYILVPGKQFTLKSYMRQAGVGTSIDRCRCEDVIVKDLN